MGKFVVKEVKNGYAFNLKASNGEIIAVSQSYSTKAACMEGVESVRKTAPKAEIEDQCANKTETVKNPKFELYKDKTGQFRFRLKASNGEIIATGEGYKSKAGCLKGINSTKKNAPDAVVYEEQNEY